MNWCTCWNWNVPRVSQVIIYRKCATTLGPLASGTTDEAMKSSVIHVWDRTAAPCIPRSYMRLLAASALHKLTIIVFHSFSSSLSQLITGGSHFWTTINVSLRILWCLRFSKLQGLTSKFYFPMKCCRCLHCRVLPQEALQSWVKTICSIVFRLKGFGWFKMTLQNDNWQWVHLRGSAHH